MKKFTFYLLLLTCFIFNSVFAQSPKLIVDFLDVGQADCIYITTPNAENVLIDAGNKEAAPLIIATLKQFAVTKLNYIIATHPDEDHIGALSAVIQEFGIGKVYLPKVTNNTKTYEDLLLAIQQKGLKISPGKSGVSFYLSKDIKLEFLAPNSDSYENLNDYSIVTKLTYNKVSCLFTGDAGEVSEFEMLSANHDLHANLLKVAHHGSNSSSSEAFLKAVSPQYAIISVGANNSYGHPEKPTLDRLNHLGIEIHRTDIEGNIIFSSDGATIKLDKQSSPIQTHAPPAVAKSETKPAENLNLTVYITRTGLKYHRAGCRYLSRSSISIDLKAAKTAGYKPCSVCKPPQ